MKKEQFSSEGAFGFVLMSFAFADVAIGIGVGQMIQPFAGFLTFGGLVFLQGIILARAWFRASED